MPEIPDRYRRFVILREVGEEGLRRLRHAKVAVVGMGGLGSISATKLTTLGVGALRLVDHDVVEATNLQRQFLYREADVGKPKAPIAARRLHPLNPEVTIEPVETKLTTETADQLIKGMSVVVDGLDRFTPRYALNRACVRQRVPYVFAGAVAANGNLTTIIPDQTPCLECIFGGVDDAQQPTAAMIGVYPTLLGVVANIQAHEALHICLGQPPQLTGRLLYVDLGTLQFDQFPVARNPACPVCGTGPRRTKKG
jgi:molybdopterin/thiamine biosynthesis adenylyltransferase